VYAQDKFLSLPFEDSEVNIQQGWKYDFTTWPHEGIDYVKRDVNRKWVSFPIYASHDGTATYLTGDSCSDGKTITYGNWVRIGTQVTGQKRSTRYAHLASSPLPPGVATPVKRGQFIGMAGDIGTCLPSGQSIHLHFEELDENNQRMDPYGIKGINTQYPGYPGSNVTTCGADNAFITCPPHVGPLPGHIGSLIRLKGTVPVYLVSFDGVNIVKRWIANPVVFVLNGFDENAINDVDRSVFSSLLRGQDITSRVTNIPAVQEGQLAHLMPDDKIQIYIASQGEFHLLKMDGAQAQSLGFDVNNVPVLNESYRVLIGKEISYDVFVICMAPLVSSPPPGVNLTRVVVPNTDPKYFGLDPLTVFYYDPADSMHRPTVLVGYERGIRAFRYDGSFLWGTQEGRS